MDYIARKINRAKWTLAPYGEEGIRADALNCLRTTSDALSFWECQDIEDAALAVAGGLHHVQTFDLVLLRKDHFSDVKQVSTPGQTVVVDLQDRHIDLKPLNIDHIQRLAQAIAEQVRAQNGRFDRFTQSKIKSLLSRAIEEGRVDTDELKPGVRKHFVSVIGDEKRVCNHCGGTGACPSCGGSGWIVA